MADRREISMGLAAGAALLAFAGGAKAGGTGGCGTCTPPPPPKCNCTVPTGHTVNVPGVWVTPPSVTVNASSVAYAEASASATASASASVLANTSALSSGTIYNGGGGSSWYVEQGAAGAIPNLQVEGFESRRVCAEMRAVEKMVAVQAVCLDDKAVPHPASQVLPERDLAGAYEGEVYRCIAGARMQYTLADYSGQAHFEHGQTITCDKGQALYHSGAGRLECRPQKPARDCNERSLLRRYGAGIKVMRLASERTCAAFRNETVAGAPSMSTMMLDGGVGGVVR